MSEQDRKASPLRELLDPFVNIVRAPRALWAVNITYFLEGIAYWGVLTLLLLHFNETVGLNDAQAGWIVGAFTGGITLAMFFFGELADRWGIRTALILSLALMAIGRFLLAASAGFGGNGIWSPVFFASTGGLFIVILGYGMFQPAEYSAVRKFTTAKTAAMGYAMLYAVNNLGGFLPGIISPPLRASVGITGVFWVYTAVSVLGAFLIVILLSKKALEQATAETGADVVFERGKRTRPPFRFRQWLKEHPLRDLRFSFFIFALIPVQTLFAHQWLTMPPYVSRAFPGWVSENMELFVNLNPILIFVLTPTVAALTSKINVYKMMIAGTVVMAAPTFLLAGGPHIGALFAYILILSIGEAMWQPRFLQLAAELAPAGKTGQYMGIAQFPWFLTKVLTSTYSGTMLARYCPDAGPQNTGMLWFIYGCIAILSPILLLLARKWMGNRLQAAHA
ncbi:MAG: MFS transporter [Bacteroidota bacterium]|nr:MFS transporter [Bacteroidota bacterium]